MWEITAVKTYLVKTVFKNKFSCFSVAHYQMQLFVYYYSLLQLRPLQGPIKSNL